MRLAELAQELLDYVDAGKIPMVVGEKLSYLQINEQMWLVEAIANSGLFPSKVQAEQLKESSSAGILTEGDIYAILVKKEVELLMLRFLQRKYAIIYRLLIRKIR